MAKIIVTGHKGFLGHHLMPLLVSHGHQVVPYEGDLLNYNTLDKFLATNSGAEFVIHLAGKFSGETPSLINSNCIATYNLINLMQRNQIKNILFSSSGAVYGEPPKNSYSKESDATQPHTIYGITKKVAESAIIESPLCSIILRFPAIYDTSLSKGVISKFLQSIQDKNEVCIHGDGTQERNFLHVQDACSGILTALDKKKFGIFNISNPKPVSINQLVSLLTLKYEFTVKHLAKNNDLNKLLLDITKAKKELNWQPKIVDLVL